MQCIFGSFTIMKYIYLSRRTNTCAVSLTLFWSPKTLDIKMGLLCDSSNRLELLIITSNCVGMVIPKVNAGMIIYGKNQLLGCITYKIPYFLWFAYILNWSKTKVNSKHAWLASTILHWNSIKHYNTDTCLVTTCLMFYIPLLTIVSSSELLVYCKAWTSAYMHTIQYI